MFASVLNTTDGGITAVQMLICMAASLGAGVLVALGYALGGRVSKPLCISLIVLPLIVQVVIMMVNGAVNPVGAGIAVMGAFSLVRFRSVPGSAREISFIFLSMAVGLATAQGYVAFALLFALVVAAVLVLLSRLPLGESKKQEKILRVLMPEDLDYSEVFDDIFEQYTASHEIERVKTTNLGSMFEVRYIITLKNGAKEKEMIDAIRCRNGNMTIVCSRYIPPNDQL